MENKETEIIINVNVEGTQKWAFDLAFELAFAGHDLKCNGYSIINNELYISHYSKESTKFAYEYGFKQVVDFAWGWYNQSKPSDKEPDTDGSTGKAWKITTEGCGVGSDDWGMFVKVLPIWFIYGK